MKKLCLISLILIPSISPLQAAPADLFAKCVAQVSGLQIASNHDLTVRVVRGELGPIQACLTVLASTRIDRATGRLKNNNILYRKTLDTMHKLHASWFGNTEFPQGPGFLTFRLLQGVYDASTPALYFTAGLFEERNNGAAFLLDGRPLQAIRTVVNSNKSPADGMTKDDTIFTNLRWADKGDLLGIRTTDLRKYNFSFKGQSGGLVLGSKLARGAAGTREYFHLTMSDVNQPDGGVFMPRGFMKHFYKDFLCRDLPMVRAEDSKPFVRPRSSIAFRTSNNCVICHVTMDRAAATIRNVFSVRVGGLTAPDVGIEHLRLRPARLPSEAAWPVASDANYHLRPPRGVIYFRNYRGQLINQPAANINDFMVKISRLDDPYICVAKRYYEYFTGFEVDIGDPGLRTIGAAEKVHRDRVIQFGRTFRQSKNVLQLIRSILLTEEYAQGT